MAQFSMKKAVSIVFTALCLCISSYAQLTGYNYRQAITIQSSQVSGSGNLTDFPILISTTQNDLRSTSNGGHVESTSGFDIAFASYATDCSGHTELDMELEYYDPVSGEVAAWVKIPTLSGSSNTTIYILYGNSSVTTDQSTTSVWSNDYRGVYHFNQSMDNSVSTSYNGTDYNTSNVSSIVGNAREFNASGDSISIPSDVIPSTGDFTVSCWFNFQGTTSSSGHTLFDIYGDGSGANAKYFYGGFTNSAMRWFYEDNDDSDAQITANITVTANTWYFYTGTGGWNQNAHELFLDGASRGTDNENMTTGLFSPRTNLLLGDRNVNYVNYDRFTGYIDEFRVSSVKRSDDWITTEYNNINDPNSFTTFGSEETLISTTIASGTYSDGGIWDNGVPNSAFSEAVISHDVLVTADAQLFKAEVQTGTTLNIQTGVTLDVCQVDNSGTVTVESTGSLLQQTATDQNTGSGTYNVRRSSGTLNDDTRFQYWSSPVQSTTMGTVFTGSNTVDFYYFDEGTTNNWASQASGGTMTPGRGYITTGTIGISDAAEIRTFPGTVNNADVSLTTSNVSSGESILAGNPYPSAIRSSTFVTDNTGINGTLWFWNHFTAESGGVNIDSDYATWTSTGSTSGNGATTPDDYVQSCQAFFVEAISSNPTITFNNDQRVSGNNTQFFKQEPQTDKHRVWLALTNDSNDFNQILIGFLPQATDGADRLYDGKKYKAHPRLAFYSLIDSVDYCIQGLNVPTYLEEKVIPLGVDAWITGSHTIFIDSLDNWPKDYSIHLIDGLNQTSQDLREDPTYTFQVDQAGEIRDRFAIAVMNHTVQDTIIQDTTITNTNEIAAEERINVFVANHELVVNSESKALKQITMHDLSGRLIFQKELSGHQIRISQTHRGVAIVSVTLADDTSYKELIYINQ